MITKAILSQTHNYNLDLKKRFRRVVYTKIELWVTSNPFDLIPRLAHFLYDPFEIKQPSHKLMGQNYHLLIY